MTKAVYMYDGNKQFTSTKLVDDDYELSGNETFIKVPDGQYQPSTFNGTTWIGNDKETWQAAQDAQTAAYLKAHPELAPQPTATDQQLAALALTVATNKATQDATNAQLLLATATQVASSKATTTDGGNA